MVEELNTIPQGGTGVTAQSKGATQMWLQMLTKMLSQQQGLLQGTGTPQELPWFKGFQEQIAKYGQNQESELIRQAAARGITGNSLATILGQSQEARNKGILGIINQIYQQAPQQAQTLGSEASNLFKALKGMQLQYLTQKNAQQGQSSINPLQAIMGGLGMAGNIGLGIMGGAQNTQFLNMLRSIMGMGSTSTSTPIASPNIW